MLVVEECCTFHCSEAGCTYHAIRDGADAADVGEDSVHHAVCDGCGVAHSLASDGVEGILEFLVGEASGCESCVVLLGVHSIMALESYLFDGFGFRRLTRW